MPNWCYTDFIGYGPAEDIYRFREAVRDSNNGQESAFYFDRLIVPPDLSETSANFGTVYNVYYGNAEPIRGYPWVKDLGIETFERLREHFDD